MSENLRSNDFIVFCQDHYNPLTLIRSLGKEGINPIVILVAKNPVLINNSKYVGKLYLVNSNEDGFKRLISFKSETGKKIVYTASDDIQSLLDERYDELKDYFIFFNGGKAGQLNKWMNKEKISLLAAEVGFRIPKAKVVSKGELPEEIPYPVMTKALDSTTNNWKADVHVCYTPDDLLKAYDRIKRNPIIVEEYIRKRNELCIDGISINGGEEVYMPYKVHYIRMSDKSYGNYMNVYTFKGSDVKTRIENLIKATGFSGIFSIEFLVTDDDDLVFLEVNFRHSTWAATSLYGGANLPVLWAQGMLSGHIPYKKLVLKTDTFRGMSEIADFNESVRTGKISFLQWLKDFHNCECTFTYDKLDKKPFFKLIVSMGVGFIKRRIFCER